MKRFMWGMILAVIGFGGTLASAQVQVKEIALLDSESTKEFFVRRGYSLCGPGSNHIGALEYERYFKGWKYVLDDQPNNILVNNLISGALPAPGSNFKNNYYILTDKKDEFDITEAKLKERGTKVLILSNMAGLSVEETREIKQWVLGGGKLIATYGSGYKGIIENPHDPEGADPLKSQKGATGGLHELWNDPWTKAFGTQFFEPDPGVDIRIFKNFGPTDIYEYSILPNSPLPVMSYGAEANLLTPRPEHYRDALAFLGLTPNPDPKKAYPAILLNRASRGTVVYFSYAPEFIVALAFNLAGHCPLDGNYPDASPDWNFPAPPALPQQVVGPVETDFPNKFVGAVVIDDKGTPTRTDDTYTQINANRLKPQLMIMKRTIDFMLTGN